MSGARLELSPSWILACAIALPHVAAAGSVVLVLDHPLGVVLGGAFLGLGLAAAWSRGLLGSARSARALELSGAEMCVELKNHRRFVAALDRRRHVSRWMVTLPVRQPVRRTILVTRDMLGGEEFRRLRLWALWGRLPRPAGVAAAQLRA